MAPPTVFRSRSGPVALLLAALGALLPLACGGGAGPADLGPRPLLWRVEGPGRTAPAWLLGTMHVADPQVLRILELVAPLLEETELLAVELPEDEGARSRLDARSRLPSEEALEDLLPPELTTRLRAFLQEEGIPWEAAADREPWYVLLLLSRLDLRSFPAGPPLDLQLRERARARGIPALGIETWEEQIQALIPPGRDAQIHLLRRTLERLEQNRREGRHPTRELLEVFLAGDEAALWEQARSEVDPADPVEAAWFEALHGERNRRMAERVDRLLRERSDQGLLFAFGALHFAGPEGLPRLLARRGWTVQRLPAAAEH